MFACSVVCGVLVVEHDKSQLGSDNSMGLVTGWAGSHTYIPNKLACSKICSHPYVSQNQHLNCAHILEDHLLTVFRWVTECCIVRSRRLPASQQLDLIPLIRRQTLTQTSGVSGRNECCRCRANTQRMCFLASSIWRQEARASARAW